MNVLVIGSGAIGIALGASMLSQKANVSFYATKKTAEAMNDGINRIGIFKHLSYKRDEFEVYTSYENIPRNYYDYIFICSKTIANDDISNNLNNNRDILKENTKIIIFQNGFGNDEPYLRFFSKKTVYCARVITGFRRSTRNTSEITVHTAPILIGSLQKQDPQSLKEVSDMINKSGIESGITEDLPRYLWAKMLYNCTLNPLGAILNVTYGKLTENPYTINIMNKLIDEIFNVIQASGYSVEWNTSEEYKEIFYNKLVPDTYEHVSSTSQDIQRKNKTEIDSLTGKVIRLGEEHKIDVSTNKVIYNLIKAIESEF
ncbi:ketopantoate reductase family protein [uncultured Methanosphaera sp.]|uniref:ketopantoate reductase family protein n=1 Tax=uncultured Methanosphaera sp. TaxID=262501 RepID=UPI000DC4705B|nr:ketopantoate reductase family protein [uncultured Methanosphaera sp.]RAP44037.1 MAG: 2-dehydropantoate 2-reductase [Methanosphaera sp. SHI1033]